MKIHIPTNINFGVGVRRDVGIVFPKGKEVNNKILVIATKSSLARQEIREVISILMSYGDVYFWEKIKPNPRVIDINACVENFEGKLFTHIFGIGGGSVMDQAKATAMCFEDGSLVEGLLKKMTPLNMRKKICLTLLPTTSGTGSEVSYGAILTDDATSRKYGLRGEALAANFTFVDPELTYSKPLRLTVLTGFDVLTHALETYISNASTIFTENLSRVALQIVFRNLPKLLKNLNDISARSELSYASLIMGINLALSSTCLPHRMQYPIGALTDTAHAEGLAALYPAWIIHLEREAPEKLSECAKWIGVGTTAEVDAVNARSFVIALFSLMTDLNLMASLRDLGVTEEMINKFTGMISGDLKNDPSYKNIKDIDDIYKKSLKIFSKH